MTKCRNLAFLENKQVLRLLSKDELNLFDIGIGVNGDGKTKTALFTSCSIFPIWISSSTMRICFIRTPCVLFVDHPAGTAALFCLVEHFICDSIDCLEILWRVKIVGTDAAAYFMGSGKKIGNFFFKRRKFPGKFLFGWRLIENYCKFVAADSSDFTIIFKVVQQSLRDLF